MKQIILAVITVLSFTACNTPATTTTPGSDSTASNMSTGTAPNSKEVKEERNKQIVETAMKGFESGGNIDMVFKDATNDVVDYGDGSMKPTKGLDSLKAAMKMWMTAMPDYKGSDFTTVADGDNVMMYGTWTGTWKGDMMGEKPTGKSFKVKDVDFFKLNEDGKIIEHRNVMPMSEIARQVGMKMPAH